MSEKPLHLLVKGNVDDYNTSNIISYWTVGIQNSKVALYSYYLGNFQPANKVSLINSDTKKYEKLSLVFNNKSNWYDINKIASEALGTSENAKTKALSLYQTINNNHVYFYSPEYYGNQQTHLVTNFLGIYGYGHCGTNINSVALIAQKYFNKPQKNWIIDNGRHGVSEININDTAILLDADESGYYLKLDNKNLASFYDVVNDRYLYYRTKLFGPAVNYSMDIMKHFASPFYSGNYYSEPHDPSGSYGSDLYFSLRPGESINYLWDLDPATVLYHHFYYPFYGYYPTTNDAQNIIGNGEFDFKTNFKNADLTEMFTDINNVVTGNSRTDSKPVLHAKTVGEPASFIVDVSSPYTILDGKIKARFFNHSHDDTISIYYSIDKINWQKLWASTQTGSYLDSISLSKAIYPLWNPALYQYYLKFEMQPSSFDEACGLDSIELKTTFQISKFFMPKLKLGDNTIVVKSETSDSLNLQLKIDWKEDHTNQPPPAPSTPIYPSDNTIIDSSYFTFIWNPVQPTDGTSIIDYQFQLSDRSDMQYALTPLFDRYLGPVNGGKPFFLPELQGFLNHGTRYYWRVRAMNDKKIWSDWSPVWSFIPQGVMPARNLHFEFSGNDSLNLVWKNNRAGLEPAYYNLYASNQSNGFLPSADNIFSTTSSTLVPINIKDKTVPRYFRTISVNHNTNESCASYYVQLPDSIQVKYGENINIPSLLQSDTISTGKNFLLYDSSFFKLNGDHLQAKKAGKTMLNVCVKEGEDTVYKKQSILIIDPLIPELSIQAKLLPFGDIRYNINIVSDGGKIEDMGICITPVNDAAESNTPFCINIINGKLSDTLQPKFNEFYIKAYALNSAGAGYSNNVLISIDGEFLLIYPNPAKGHINIQTQNKYLNASFKLFSAGGKLLKTELITNTRQQINLSSLSKGVYIYKIQKSGLKGKEGKIVLQ